MVYTVIIDVYMHKVKIYFAEPCSWRVHYQNLDLIPEPFALSLGIFFIHYFHATILNNFIELDSHTVLPSVIILLNKSEIYL